VVWACAHTSFFKAMAGLLGSVATWGATMTTCGMPALSSPRCQTTASSCPNFSWGPFSPLFYALTPVPNIPPPLWPHNRLGLGATIISMLAAEFHARHPGVAPLLHTLALLMPEFCLMVWHWRCALRRYPLPCLLQDFSPASCW